MKRDRSLVTFDWALKRLLRSKANFNILEGLLSELLMTDIQIIEILESESNQEDRLDKYNRVDLKVRNGQGEVILIELQYEREFDYLQRVLYGVSRTITEHLDASDPYSRLPKVISVSILYFDLGQGDDYIYHGTTSFKGLHTHDELVLNEGQKDLFRRQLVSEIFPEFYLLKVNRFNDVARDPLDEWIYFLKNGEIRAEFTARGLDKAKELLDILKLPAAERRAYERYREDLHFQASMVESTWVAGRLEGRREGKREGKREERIEMMLELLQERFGAVPDWVQARLAAADPETLKRWGKRMMGAETMEQVFRSEASDD
ncbi:MAG: Rpn family recombination-promoting nuclease/putative transposase [Magnetococcales bacterium]|nr:Rpn family recombination-promoting nuclease/putative transposase [Magnetococcales bacterium]